MLFLLLPTGWRDRLQRGLIVIAVTISMLWGAQGPTYYASAGASGPGTGGISFGDQM